MSTETQTNPTQVVEQPPVERDPKKEMCEGYRKTIEFFDKLPACITNQKQECFLNKGNENRRFLILCLGALGVAGITARCIQYPYSVQPSFIKIARNTVISYIGGGLFLVPEVFNPYLIYRFKGE